MKTAKTSVKNRRRLADRANEQTPGPGGKRARVENENNEPTQTDLSEGGPSTSVDSMTMSPSVIDYENQGDTIRSDEVVLENDVGNGDMSNGNGGGDNSTVGQNVQESRDIAVNAERNDQVGTMGILTPLRFISYLFERIRRFANPFA